MNALFSLRLLPFCFACLVGLPALGGPGDLDPTFDPGTGPNAVVRTVVVQQDGRILIGGMFDGVGAIDRIGVARLTQTSQLDESFNPAAIAGEVLVIARQPDARILIAGDIQTPSGIHGIARLDSDGRLDPTFHPVPGPDGRVWSVALQPDGKLLIGGDFTTVGGIARSGVARLNADGTFDATFGQDLVIDGPLRAVRLLQNGQILIAGNFATVNSVPRGRIARLSADGTLDVSFIPGKGADSWVSAVAVQPDGRILIGGSFNSFDGTRRRRVARLNNDGTVDFTFDPGTGASDTVSSIALQSDGKILIVGGFRFVDDVLRNRIARLFPNGILDPSFAPDSGADAWVETVAVQSDGRILIGGDFTLVNNLPRVRIARFQGGDPPPVAPVIAGPPGTITISAGSDLTIRAGATASPSPTYRWFFNAIEIPGATRDTLRLTNVPTNQAGTYSVEVRNMLGTATGTVATVTVLPPPIDPGAPDPSFYAGTGPDGAVYGVAIAPDNKMLIGGAFHYVDGLPHSAVARLQQDGRVDEAFQAMVIGEVRSLALRPDGKILLAGYFYEDGGSLLAKQLNNDGSVDSAFQAAIGYGYTSKILLLPNQQMLVGGPFVTAEASRWALARLHSNGALDVAFNADFSSGAVVDAMGLQSDNRVIVGGLFTSVAGVSRRNLVRINLDGTVDPSFNPGAGPNGGVSAVAIQADGKVLVAGRFSRFGGLPRLRLARLNSNGSVDANFDAGTLLTRDDITAIALQSDGKIVVGTTHRDADFAIARLHTDGSLDGTFRTVPLGAQRSLGPSGGIIAIQVRGDGRVLIAGEFSTVNNLPRPRLARLLGGAPPLAAPVLLVSPTGRNVTAGADVTFEVVASSAPAPSYQWQFNGADLPGETRAFLTVRNVRYIHGGSYSVVVRNASGAATSAAAVLTVLAPAGNPGAPEIGFYSGLGPDSRLETLVIQPDGKVVIGGAFTDVNGIARNRIARVNRDGSLDLNFDPGSGADNIVLAVALQPDGKLLVGGQFLTFNGQPRPHLARLNSDGTLDASFNANAAPNGDVGAIVIQPNGAILIGGSFGIVDNVLRSGLARLNANGSFDASFASAFSGKNLNVAALVLQPNSAILAGGFFSMGTQSYVARLLASGSPDASFNVGSGTSYTVEAIALESDGQILIGGRFTAVGQTSRPYLARLNPNGSLDASFLPQLDGAVLAIAVQSDQKILVGGSFNTAGTAARARLARLNSNGTVDSTFDVGTGFAGGSFLEDEYGEYGDDLQQPFVSAISLEAQNTAVIGGNFMTVDGAARPNLARVYLREASTIDTDLDTLPDWWEQQFGLNPYSSIGAQGGTGDFDRDGRSNRIEYINGTDPMRASSIEPRVVVAPISPGVRALRFPTIANRLYRIYYTNNLTQPFTPISPPIAGTGGEVTWTDNGSQTGGDRPARFYKLQVELPPP